MNTKIPTKYTFFPGCLGLIYTCGLCRCLVSVLFASRIAPTTLVFALTKGTRLIGHHADLSRQAANVFTRSAVLCRSEPEKNHKIYT